MISHFQLNVSPTQDDLEAVKKWLVEEYNNFGEGFYCNWSIIDKAFRANKLLTFHYENSPIGFVVWSEREIYLEIDILEIKPSLRKKRNWRGICQSTF